ncbi:PREDICTED: acetyl-CoA acetyltransferase, cytosolic [Dufourea novaeangliae]|uniref:Acetyl-CoA acetyltransferase, cytosolic n=1 Tax=Dufourea novaeangliae TaxID=178035 RepID=A0A154PMP4_DUFNO|nr:PREDICTED: acetyl-CoA acetyltransferase, cytosolic [Dufourea novaeangliae]KZC12568.1 Acetyl-CoA acetyltransferase, cytosolic [Dufourea novaeangliae]
MSASDVVIVSAVRTPIGSFCGSLSSIKTSDLGTIVIKESLKRANIEPSDVTEVILGQVLTAGQGQNPARQAAIKAGIPITVPAYLVNMLCGSGLKAVMSGYTSIKVGESEIVVTGGQECMSQAPHVSDLRNGVKLGDCNFLDSLLSDGLTDAFHGIQMGVTAENIVAGFNISREEQDEYAAKSQQKVEAAMNAAYFNKEIVSVTVPTKKGPVIVDKDEFPKFGTTVEALKKLRPAFIKTNGTVTAGNSSGINDGAAALVLMSAETAAKRGLLPLGTIVAVAQTGVDPRIMGTGPIPAVELVLKKAKWTKEEVDLYELNEAFAAQSIACIKNLGLDPSKVNINGGAIALGHPIGASGARVLVTLLHSLERTGGIKGVAALCIGGGMGIAIAVQRK